MLANRRLSFDRQQFAVTPHRPRSGADLIAGNMLADGVVIVGRFQRTKIEFAHVDGVLRILAATFATLQVREKR